MKQIIFSNWTFIRFIRLAMGIAIVVQAVIAKDIMFGIAGLLFTGLAVFNLGCCGTGSCYTPINKTNTSKDIIYEEVD
jgi:hypothetical protein